MGLGVPNGGSNVGSPGEHPGVLGSELGKKLIGSCGLGSALREGVRVWGTGLGDARFAVRFQAGRVSGFKLVASNE